MNTIELYIISLAFSLIWFDVLYIQTPLKRILGYKEIDFIKPFDCRFCTFHHIGFITGLIYYSNQMIHDHNFKNFIIYAFINFALTNIITRKWD